MIKLNPKEAWLKYLSEPYKNAGWIEDSKNISNELALSKRELFGLILLAYISKHLNKSDDWFIGYDKTAPEPNDGLISNGKTRVDIEHKLVPQMTTEEALNSILSTYDKYAEKGTSYGEDRTLIIHGNKGGQGLIKISDLRKRIAENNCPFDSVLFIGAVAIKGEIVVMHIMEHFPENGMAQINLNTVTGEADVLFSDLKTLPEIIKST